MVPPSLRRSCALGPSSGSPDVGQLSSARSAASVEQLTRFLADVLRSPAAGKACTVTQAAVKNMPRVNGSDNIDYPEMLSRIRLVERAETGYEATTDGSHEIRIYTIPHRCWLPSACTP